jgi:hypothetical protein
MRLCSARHTAVAESLCKVHHTLSARVSTVLSRVSDPNIRNTIEFCGAGATHPRPPVAQRVGAKERACLEKQIGAQLRRVKNTCWQLVDIRYALALLECIIMFVDRAHV